MSISELGPIGVELQYRDTGDFRALTAELERLGYGTIWLAGGSLDTLGPLGDVLRSTTNVPVGSAIISADVYGAEEIATSYAELEAAHPGRFVVGLGGGHGPNPLRTIASYLDRLDTVPPTVPAHARVLSAIGPRMLELARTRAAGTVPLLVTPEYTAQMRSALGQGPDLIVDQFVVLEKDPERAREIARVPLRFLLGGVSGYVTNTRRMGFTDTDIAELSDRLVDALVAWGDRDTVAERLDEHRRAGADQVALSVLDPDDATPADQLRELAGVLLR